MSKNVVLNGQTYNGVSEVSLPVSGGTANFKDVDEIVETDKQNIDLALALFGVTAENGWTISEVNIPNAVTAANYPNGLELSHSLGVRPKCMAVFKKDISAQKGGTTVEDGNPIGGICELEAFPDSDYNVASCANSLIRCTKPFDTRCNTAQKTIAIDDDYPTFIVSSYWAFKNSTDTTVTLLGRSEKALYAGDYYLAVKATE